MRNLKKIILGLGLSLLGGLQVWAQPYGNEWVNFSQPYYKIPTAQDGIYRLAYEDLQSAGFPVDAVDPQRLQIFHRGVEQAIHVQGEGDASFDPGDFVEFYGQRNDGTLDVGLYVAPEAQIHPFYNLYSDTTAYFLTFFRYPERGAHDYFF